MSDERVVLVTGAASGIGQATAQAFAARGWTVYATDVETPLPDVLAERCRCLELDVSDAEQCRAVVKQVVEEAGSIDCLVNNAGYAVAGPVEDIDSDDVRDAFDVLVHGPHVLYQAVLPEMRASGGRIVTVSSVLARVPYPGVGGYSGGKAALTSMTDALRMELADTAVDVALVEPAWVETDFADGALSGLPAERTPAYDGIYEALEAGWILDADPLATPPEAVADAIVLAATDKNPKTHYPVGRFASFVYWTEWVPPAVVDRIRRAFAWLTPRLSRWVS